MGVNVRVMEWRLRKANALPSDFAFFSWECFPKRADRLLYVELRGGVCPLYKSGKNKGRPNYSKSEREMTFCVTPDESAAWEREYARETGNCPECMGAGKNVSRCGVNIETEYRECRACSGSGRSA